MKRQQLVGFGLALGGGIATLMLAAGCNWAPPPVDTKAAEDAVRAADVAWSKSAASGNAAQVAAYYTDDATVLPPNEPILHGRDAAQSEWSVLLAQGASISWKPMNVSVAGSGDMAYSQGTYSLSMKDADGKPQTDTGKYLEVWKKQGDGTWKAAEDTWNSDLPAALTAPTAPSKTK